MCNYIFQESPTTVITKINKNNWSEHNQHFIHGKIIKFLFYSVPIKTFKTHIFLLKYFTN